MARFDPQLLPPYPDLTFETGLWELGAIQVCGIDEAGRGALAGPVTAAALILPVDPKICHNLEGLQDSKALNPNQREFWAECLQEQAADLAAGSASPQEIDQIGIIPATRLAAQRALESLQSVPDHLILDYLFLPENPLPQTSLTKGDARCLSIAAASILAKVTRDNIMRELNELYPEYGFAAHKGYGTAKHRLAIQSHGPCPVHRFSFAPMATPGENTTAD